MSPWRQQRKSSTPLLKSQLPCRGALDLRRLRLPRQPPRESPTIVRA